MVAIRQGEDRSADRQSIKLQLRDLQEQIVYPRGIRLLLTITGLVLSIFTSALDSTIISAAIPAITTEFGTISDIAWYGTSLVITHTAFQSCWGKAYKYFSLKTVFLLSLLVFEVGNIICALASSSEVLIFGRIVAGCGSGGIMTGAFIIIALTARPRYRALYMGVLGVTFGSSGVLGPILGGILTDGPGWRFCFWINLPIAFVAATAMFLFFRSPVPPKEAPLPEKILQLDINGGILIAGFLSCFVLAMHWLGKYPPNSIRIIGSFAGFASLLGCFIGNEWAMGKRAMIQLNLLRNKMIVTNACYIFFLAGAYFPLLYTLPVQFQSVNNKSASQSGIRLIPLILGISAVTMVANGILTFWRHYKPFLLVGAILVMAGDTKIYASNARTHTSEWIGYEILSAVGIGMALQIPVIANQALVSADDMAAVTTLTLFMENCGETLFVASCAGAFTNGLLSSLGRNLPEIDSKTVLDAGATQIRHMFSGSELEHVLMGYLEGCKSSHLITIACGAIASLISFSNAGPAVVSWAKLKLKKAHER
ncbi:MFS gliotoxin efflux transporter glia [Didymella exigua CBS 183.55]|uniref:MFS gliotoxin efflux transporter glia n=1 Tax=Didymella exigua CBS 183.55 TaxID=1150837 RepID=A0A6A5RVV3_9PLEO|nr:MFS gliotoxin efflux transporter glia [Didymella exigua CBS 183.55]KAF1931719.1 MFS gliotoxin efflux transporter glia [Didymella exigua CBS 183.55]